MGKGEGGERGLFQQKGGWGGDVGGTVRGPHGEGRGREGGGRGAVHMGQGKGGTVHGHHGWEGMGDDMHGTP